MKDQTIKDSGAATLACCCGHPVPLVGDLPTGPGGLPVAAEWHVRAIMRKNEINEIPRN